MPVPAAKPLSPCLLRFPYTMLAAFLGDDPWCAALAGAAAAQGWQVAWYGGAEDAGVRCAASTLPDEGWERRELDRWPELLDPTSADAIVVGQRLSKSRHGGPESIDVLRELVQHGRPVLVVFPLTLDATPCYVIDLLCREAESILEYFHPGLETPWIAEAAAACIAGESEQRPLEQVVATRSLACREREHVLRHLLRDVDLLGRIAGPIDRVAAHGGAKEAPYAVLSVELVGRNQLPVRWSVTAALAADASSNDASSSDASLPHGSPAERLEIRLISSGATRSTTWDADGRWQGALPNPKENQSKNAAAEQSPIAAEACRAWGRFTQRLAAAEDPVHHEAPAQSAIRDWAHALRAVELVDAIKESLHKGRTVDVHPRQLTPGLAFRGVMAAAGCGLLLVLAPLLALAGWLAGVAELPIAHYWPHALLAAMTLFLVLQVFGQRR